MTSETKITGVEKNEYTVNYFPAVSLALAERGVAWINSTSFTYGDIDFCDDLCQASRRRIGTWIVAHSLLPETPRQNLHPSPLEDPIVYNRLRVELDKGTQDHVHGHSTLPFFAADHSEYILSSLIERSEVLLSLSLSI